MIHLHGQITNITWLKPTVISLLVTIISSILFTQHNYSISIDGTVGLAETIGQRQYMEDTNSILIFPCNNTKIHFYAIYDGHGGSYVSQFLKFNLLSLLQEKFSANICNNHTLLNDQTIASLVNQTFFEINKNILQEDQSYYAGSTCLLLLKYRNRILSFNVGDSRANLYSFTTAKFTRNPLSFDHKPDHEAETKRIVAAGGFVSKPFGVARVNGILATSRAFGDASISNVLTVEPGIVTLPLNRRITNIAVLATDGLWDVFSNEEVGEWIHKWFFKRKCSLQRLAKLLLAQAKARKSKDNITVMIVRL